MNKLSACSAFLVVLLCLTSQVTASQKAELNLWKFNEFLYGRCGWCGEPVDLKEGESLPSMADRTGFSLYNQDGYYAVILKGSSETTMTLFGANDYSSEQGFLIIIKRDDKTISIYDLEAFYPHKWITIKAKERVSGAYSVYYRPYPRFKNNIRSVNWGHWWNSLSSLVEPAS